MKKPGRTVSYAQILTVWPLVEFSFHAALGVDLEDVWRTKSWRWFRTRVNGLLSADTPLARHFQPEPDAKEPPSE